MATSVLAELERHRDRFDAAATRRKLRCLRVLARTRLTRADQVRRLHEVLCFLRAYPDGPDVLRAVVAMLDAFDRRADLRAHRDALAYSGIAGTALWFPYFYPTARWLARRWPRQLVLDRNDTVAGERIADLLPALLTPAEAHGLREARLAGFDAIDRLRGRESDATFLVRRAAAQAADDRLREALYDAINPSIEVQPGRDTPARSRDVVRGLRPVWQTGPLQRERPDLAAAAMRAPRRLRAAPRAQARALIELARRTLATRQRDLDAFAYANERDVWWIEDDGGLAFALIGMRPERRAVVPAIYGGLTLHNGVPVGYHQTDLIGRSAALAFNAFETFRGGEAAHAFSRLLAALVSTFGALSFSVEPYQLGDRNDEGLASGAWWFYARLGFRPRARDALALARRELARRAAAPDYRSPPDVLRALARHHVFFDVDPRDPAPLVTSAGVGLAAARHLTRVAGSDRAAGVARASAHVMRACGLRSLAGLTAAERLAWEAYAPVLAMLPLRRWPATDRDAVLRLVRAKGAASERAYVREFAALPRLARALAEVERVTGR